VCRHSRRQARLVGHVGWSVTLLARLRLTRGRCIARIPFAEMARFAGASRDHGIEQLTRNPDEASDTAAGALPPPPGVALGQLLRGSLVTQLIHVAAKLGIADLLREGP